MFKKCAACHTVDPARPFAGGRGLGGGVVDAAHAEADRLRGDCDVYVDEKLAEFEEILTGTLRSVNRGRHQLRTGAGMHDYVEYPRSVDDAGARRTSAEQARSGSADLHDHSSPLAV